MLQLQDWINEFQGDPDYEFDKVAIEVGEQIVARMEERGMTQADLAREMGVTRARVSQILRGHDNLTLKSIVAVAIGLDSRVDFHLRDARAIASGPKGASRHYRQIAEAEIPRSLVRFTRQDWRTMSGVGMQDERGTANESVLEFSEAA